MSVMLGAALGAAVAIGVLLGYLPVHSKLFGLFHWSPRLTACWWMPILDVIVTLYLIGGGWFGFTSANMGIQMTLFSVFTAIGLSLTTLVVRKLFAKRWRREFEETKRFGTRRFA